MERFPEYFQDCFMNDLRTLDLLMMRNDPSMISRSFASSVAENPTFQSLPAFPKDLISKVISEFKSKHNLRSALNKNNISNDFKQDNLIEIITAFEAERTDINNFALLYQILLWFGQDDSKLTEIMFRKILEIFNSFADEKLSQLNHITFMSLCTFGLTDTVIQLTNSEISLIIKYIISNDNIPNDLFPLLMLLTDYAANVTDKEIYRSIIYSIISLFENNRPIIQHDHVHILSHILVNKINDLEPLSILLVCYCAQHSQNSTIMDTFLLLPSHVLNSLSNKKVVFSVDEFTNPLEIKNQTLTPEEYSMMKMPNQTIIESGGNYEDIVSFDISELIKLIQPVIGKILPSVASQFLNSIHAIGKATKNVAQRIDFALVIAPLIEELSNNNDITPVKECLFDNVIFNPDVTLFHENPPKYLNFVRNTILKSCCKDKTLLTDVLISFVPYPYLFSELILRFLYLPSLDDQFVFHIIPHNVINALIQVTLSFPHEELFKKQTAIARSICLTYLFDLFAVPENAARCFESDRFMCYFSVLMEERILSAAILKSLESALTGLKTLPEPILIAISCILTKCSIIHDEFFSNLGRSLSKIVVDTLLINQSIRGSILNLINPLISIFKKIPDSSTLKTMLDMLFAVVQHSESLDLSDGRFLSMAQIIQQVEDSKPSESTVLRLFNILSNSSTTTIGKAFIIKAPALIPLIIVATYKSDIYIQVLDFFLKLAECSDNNSVMMHEGDLPIILINQLRGKFDYKGFIFERSYTSEEINDHVFPLLLAIMKVKSSCTVDRHLFKLIMPENGVFPSLSVPVLKLMNSIITAKENDPNPQYEILRNDSLIDYPNIPFEKMNQNLFIKILLKVDSKFATNSTFSLFSFEDESNPKCTLDFYILVDTLVVRYYKQNVRSTATVIKKIPDNEWTKLSISVFNTGEGRRYCPCIEHQFKEETEYAKFEFTSKVTMHVAKTDDFICNEKTLSPVTLGSFQILSGEITPDDTLNLVELNHDALCKHPLCIINSDNLVSMRKYKNPDISFLGTLPVHICLTDFIPVFDVIKNAPPHYAELLIPIIMRGRNLKFSTTKRITNITSTWSEDDTNKFISNLTGTKLEQFSSLGEIAKISTPKSDISGLVFTIARNLPPDSLNFHLFNSITSILPTVESSELRREIIEDVIFNVWLWSNTDEFTQKKISLYYINKADSLATPSLFSLFLFRSFVLLNHSERQFPSLSSSFIKILESISTVYVTEQDVSYIIKIIEYLDDTKHLSTYGVLLESLILRGIKISPEDANRFIKITEKCSFAELRWLIGVIQIGCVEQSKYILYHMVTRFISKQEFNELPLNIDMRCIDYLYKGDENVTIQPFDNPIISIEHLWFLWPLMTCLWLDRAIDQTIKYMVPPLMNSAMIDTYLNEICICLDLFESLNIFSVEQFRYKLFDEIIDFIDQIKPVEKNQCANALCIYYVQEFLFHFVEKSYSVEVLECLGQDSTGFVTGKDEFNDLLSQHDSSMNNRKFTFSEFNTRLSTELKRYRYMRRCLVSNEEFFRLTKKVYECISMYAGGTEYIKNAIKYIGMFTESIPECRTDPFDFMLSANYVMEKVKINLLDIQREIIAILQPPLEISENDERSSYSNIRIQLKYLRDQFHSSLVFSENRSKSIVKANDYVCPSKMIPLTMDPIFPPTQPQLYNSLFATEMIDVPSFDESREQFKCPATILVSNERIPVVFELWYTKLLLRMDENMPLSIDFSRIKFVVCANNQLNIVSFTSNSIVIEFNPNDFISAIQQFARLSVPIADPQKQIEELSKKWSNGELSNFELILHTNIIFGKNFDDYNNYVEFPALLADNKAIKFGVYQKSQTNEGKDQMVAKVLDSNEIDIAAEIQEQFSKFGTTMPEFYIGADTFARKSKVVTPEQIQMPASVTYMYRMWLELQPMTEKIVNFLNAKFGVTFPTEVTKIASLPKFTHRLPIKDKNFTARFIMNSNSDFACVISPTKLYIYFVEFSKDMKLTMVKCYINDQFFNCPAIFTDGWVYVPTPNSEVKIMNHKAYKTEKVDSAITHISICVKRIVYATDNGVVGVSDAQTFPKDQKLLMVPKAQITHLVTSDEFDVCVVVESTGKITVVCISDTYVYGSILIQEPIMQVCVTSAAGFIVVATKTSFYVLSLSCQVLNKCSHKHQVMKMLSVRTSHGIDYVYFSDARSVYVFEAFFPSNIKQIMEMPVKISSLSYCQKIYSLLCLTVDNKITSIPAFVGR